MTVPARGSVSPVCNAPPALRSSPSLPSDLIACRAALWRCSPRRCSLPLWWGALPEQLSHGRPRSAAPGTATPGGPKSARCVYSRLVTRTHVSAARRPPPVPAPLRRPQRCSLRRFRAARWGVSTAPGRTALPALLSSLPPSFLPLPPSPALPLSAWCRHRRGGGGGTWRKRSRSSASNRNTSSNSKVLSQMLSLRTWNSATLQTEMCASKLRPQHHVDTV